MKRHSAMVKVLRIVCALLMLSLGFAHHPARAMAAALETFDPAYRLPDGTYASICRESGNGEMPDAVPFCDACVLASSILVPSPDSAVWLITDFVSLANEHAAALTAPCHPRVERPRSQGPPVFPAI